MPPSVARSDALLSARDLEKHYPVRGGLLRRVTGHVRAVDGVSSDVHEGETLGLVGESGCGKSTTATTLVGLEEPTGGVVTFDGEPVEEFGRDERDAFRRRVQMVFQDPTTAFDPRMTVGESVAEPLLIHGLDRDRAREVVADLLERVGLSADDADSYPDAFSGGERQRVALARALSLDPDLLVLDEPVSALDASVQAEVLDLLDRLQSAYDLSVLLISHDLSVVRQVCDRVAVMYLGEVVERGPVEDIFAAPAHPYTEALLASVPRPEPGADLPADLVGDVPDPADPPPGCRFHPRCPRVIPPEGYDLTPAETRGVLSLWVALDDADADPDGGDRASADLRDAHDLPGRLSDDDAEAILADALSAARVDPDRAREELSPLVSVCGRETPPSEDVGDGREATCHHHGRLTTWPPEN